MGYRSDVAYLIAGPLAEVRRFLTTVRLTRPDLAGALREVVVGAFDGETAYIGFHEGYVKWYQEYADVATHEALWTLAEEFENADDDDHLEGRFCRLGEDDDDVEVREFGDGGYDLYEVIKVERRLTVDFSTASSDDLRPHWKEDPTWMPPPTLTPTPAPAPPKPKTRLKKKARMRPACRLTGSTITPRKWRARPGAPARGTTSGGTPSMTMRCASAR